MSILSPAKINLMLRILGQRKDGYHLLQTYFQLLDWGDEMEFNLSHCQDIQIDGNFQGLPQKQNLINKAAMLLKPFQRNKCGVHIIVKKNIPQGSGLGGGSSNAATTLKQLNHLWQCHLPLNKLQKLGLQLGADVPVFLLNQSAMATGIGEELSIYPIQEHYFVLIFPATSIATSEVFNDKNLVRNDKPIEINKINDKKFWGNSCLPVVLNNFPEISKLYESISKQNTVYMSGTGSTLFTCFDNQQSAQDFTNLNRGKFQTALCKSKIN